LHIGTPSKLSTTEMPRLSIASGDMVDVTTIQSLCTRIPCLRNASRNLGAPGLRADIVLAEDGAGRQKQREARARFLVGRHVSVTRKLPLPRTKLPTS
jgi:hypothetical protein